MNPAQFIMENDALFFDTETTGIGEKDQVLTLSILGSDEKVIYNKLFIPTVPIHPQAEAVHGISLEKCQKEGIGMGAEVYGIKKLFAGRVVVAYNMMFDHRLTWQSLTATGKPYPNTTPLASFDAMIMYSEYARVPGQVAGSFKWFKLNKALTREKIDVSDLAFHDSADDVRGMIRLVKFLAGKGY